MRVAVTGASGFVGGAVCRALVAEGSEVLAFGRRASVAPEHVGGAPYHAWDITTGPVSGQGSPDGPGTLDGLDGVNRVDSLVGVDVVVHCAGSVSDWGPVRDFFATNLRGTWNVLASWPYARFVHVSTASVYDPYVPTVMATEDQAPVARYVNAYGTSKAAAERAVLAALRDPRREAVILRPHAIYGPGDTTLLPRVLSAVRGRLLLAVGDGRQRVSLTSVNNLVQACVLAVRGAVGRGVFNVTDAEPVILDDALRWILAECGIDARPYYLPPKLVLPIAGAAEGAFLLARSPKPPRLTRYALGHLAVERTLDISAARKRLGYLPTPTDFTGLGG